MTTTRPELSLLQVAEVGGKRRIVDAQGSPIRLRGVCIGGWMNMENFIDGYPGAEHSLRTVMASILGPEKARFFFDRLLDHFLGEADIAFIRRLGANVVRLALNYRHFEDDGQPRVYKEEGFRRLDRTIEWCARHGVYAILDLHAVQGWQNPDWHSDNRHKHALLWTQPHFQDRCVALWEELARRYQDTPVIAGYDIMNEPQTRDTLGPQDWAAINRLYRRIVEAIRRIDAGHIIFLEGDAFSSRFEGLEPPFAENVVYSSHDYSLAGFGPGPYPGETGGKYRDREVLRQNALKHQGTRYAQEHDVPLWVGEFGSVYNGPRRERPDRLRALDDQLDVFDELELHWTIWTYKDVGVMGVVTVDPRSEYLRRARSVLTAKRKLASDAWMQWLPATAAERRVAGLAAHAQEIIGDTSPRLEEITHTMSDMVLAGYVATLLQPAYAMLFRDMPEEQIDDVLRAFALDCCRPNRGLVKVLKKHMGRPA